MCTLADANISSVQNELFKLKEELVDVKRSKDDALYQVRFPPPSWLNDPCHHPQTDDCCGLCLTAWC